MICKSIGDVTEAKPAGDIDTIQTDVMTRVTAMPFGPVVTGVGDPLDLPGRHGTRAQLKRRTKFDLDTGEAPPANSNNVDLAKRCAGAPVEDAIPLHKEDHARERFGAPSRALASLARRRRSPTACHDDRSSVSPSAPPDFASTASA